MPELPASERPRDILPLDAAAGVRLVPARSVREGMYVVVGHRAHRVVRTNAGRIILAVPPSMACEDNALVCVLA